MRALAAAAAAAALAGCGIVASPPSSGAPGGAPVHSDTPSAAPSSSQPVSMSALRSPGPGKFIGLEAIGAPNSLTPVSTFAANIGRKPNLLGQYIEWGRPFDADAVANTWSYGALYYMSWEPFGTTVQAIADGGSDAYITRFAQAVRALGLPVAISFGHEMNGNWYPWGSSQATATAFVTAWRHIHDLFAQAGASNVIWVWNPNIINGLPQIQLQPYYPGDAFVDWVGITGYFATPGPQTFAGLYQPTMKEIRKFTAKPFIIAETSVQSGPEETAAVKSLVAGVRSHPLVLGFMWFDYDKAGVNWTVESRPPVRAAIAADVAGFPLFSATR